MLMILMLAYVLELSAAFQFPDCAKGPLSSSTICNASTPVRLRALDFISKLTLEERLSRLDSNWGTGAVAIPRLGIPMYQWINDALHGLTGHGGIVFATGNAPFNSSTSFPSPINFAATFNDANAGAEGNIIGVEARAFSNAGRAGLDLWSPNINPFRDPRWGRGQEVPGEDPLVISRYVSAFVNGMQIGEDSRYLLVAANCKHFAAYDVENWGGTDRYSFNAVVSLRELVEYYLPPFRSCVTEGKAVSIMCSYNALNGIPSCANGWLMQTLARETWGFDPLGFVTSDCDAVEVIWDSHNYTTTPQEAAALALKAGTDTDCGLFYTEYLETAYNQSLISDADINQSILRLTSTLIRLGYFDAPEQSIYRSYGIEHVNTEFGQALSQSVAEQSFVLLKNNGSVLPIASSVTTVALIGPFVFDTYFIQGNYRGQPNYVVSIFEGMQSISGIKLVSALGCDVSSTNTSGFKEAVTVATQADLVIFVGGIDETIESEGNDRLSIAWPGVQQQLIQQLENVGKTLIVLVVGGGQVDLTYEKYSPHVNAIMWIGYPSQSCGTAVANVLFGKVAPAGRLPLTQYNANYVNQISMLDMGLRPTNTTPGRTYMFYTGDPVYAFGFGLGYTTFSYTWGQSAKKTFSINSLVKRGGSFQQLVKAPFASFIVNVTNVGKFVSDHSVLLFINSSVPDTAQAQLIDYTRLLQVAPGETRTVYFTPTLSSITTVSLTGDRQIQPAKYRLWIGSANEAQLDHSFELNGSLTILERLPPLTSKHVSILRR